MAYKFVLDNDASLGDLAYVAKWLRTAIIRAMANASTTDYVYDGEAVAEALKQTLPKCEDLLRELAEIDKGTQPGGRYWKSVWTQSDRATEDKTTGA